MKVRLYSHIGAGTGYARMGEMLARALITAGCELEVRPLLPWNHVRLHPDDILIRHLRRDNELTPPDATVVHTLPVDVRTVLKALSGTPHAIPVLNSKLVAYTTWEFQNDIPASIAADMTGDYDDFWWPCAQNRRAAEIHLGGHVVPIAYDPKEWMPERERYDDRFTFYYVGAWTDRKNPIGIVKAYAKAFGHADKVRLRLQVAGADLDRVKAEIDQAIGPDTADRPMISVHAGRVSERELWYMHRSSDCFVSATRGEAWNLPAFEALCAGRAIIHTAGTGADDFLADTTALMVPAAPAKVTPGSDATWLEIDHDALVLAMLACVRLRVDQTLVHYNLADRYSYAAVGAQARNLLENIKQP